MKTTTARSTTDPPPRGGSESPWLPLSDNGRWPRVGVLAIVLLAGGWHLTRSLDVAVVDLAEMLAEPDAHVGETVMLGNVRVVAMEGDSVDLWSPWTPARATPPPEGLAIGDPVSLVGTFGADGRVHVEQWQVHEQLKLKKGIGISVLALAIALAWWDLRRERSARA